MAISTSLDQCPAGGPHIFEWVPAGIETGLYASAWLCEACGRHAPRLDMDGEPIPEPVYTARTLTAADLAEDERPF